MMNELKYKIIPTSSFKRDYRLAQKQGCNMKLIDSIIIKLAMGLELPIECRDHKLHGNYEGYRECHIEPDWLLIYKRTKNCIRLELTLYRTGSHSDLFKK